MMGFGGFASGLASGLSQAMAAKRQRDQLAEQQREFNLNYGLNQQRFNLEMQKFKEDQMNNQYTRGYTQANTWKIYDEAQQQKMQNFQAGAAALLTAKQQGVPQDKLDAMWQEQIQDNINNGNIPKEYASSLPQTFNDQAYILSLGGLHKSTQALQAYDTLNPRNRPIDKNQTAYYKDPQTGQPKLGTINQIIEHGLTPIADPTQNGSLKVTTPGGFTIQAGSQVMGNGVANQNGDNGYQIPEAQQNELMKDSIAYKAQLGQLDALHKSFDPSYLGYAAQGKEKLFGMMEKAGLATPDMIKFSQGYNDWASKVNQFTLGALKTVGTGRYSTALMNKLNETLINTNMTPSEYEAHFNAYKGYIMDMMKLKESLMAQGLKPGTDQYQKAFDDNFVPGHQLYKNISTGAITTDQELRMKYANSDLAKKGVSYDDALSKLGYIKQ